ncbi:NgoFVII family restriction endonuclease [Alphaproteobacteria bacterium]|nr:NgoFVII family restriction endonuclease [Alphaproteobacteria bacterium]
MITENLYEKILIDPATSGCNELFIVSGFSSATFLSRNFEDIKGINSSLKINLLIGMHQKRNDHSAYLNIKNLFGDRFEGYYFSGTPQVHSKTYAWTKNGVPKIGFSGSANYSQYGFFNSKQQNQMTEDNPIAIKNYFENLKRNSIRIENYIVSKDEIINIENVVGSLTPGEIEWIEYNKSVRISLLSRNSELPARSGLNWGQRPEYNRDPNQAYLSIRSDARREGFLPEKSFTFTLLTDDNKTLDCVVAQDGRKAIHTTKDNSLLGKYFRDRLGIELGSLVTKDDLIQYGRTDFLLKKLDDETFFLDFSKP